MDQAPENVEQQGDTVVCIGCARPMPADADFCPHCGAPNGPYCWWDPWKRVFASGHVYRRLVGGPISRFVAVVVLIWIVLNIGALLYAGRGLAREQVPDGAGSPVRIMGFLLIIAVLLAFLRRVLLNYMRHHPKEDGQ